MAVVRRAIGVFHNRHDTEQALRDLSNSGIAMDKVSVIARDGDRHGDIAGTPVTEKVGDKSDEGATIGAVSGGALGGLTGLLVGLGTLAIPGIGPIMLAGAAATALATTVAGGAIGAAAGSLLGGLIGLGIPEERARMYNERVERGGYLVIFDGTEAEIARVEPILRRWNIDEFNVFDRPTSENVASDRVAPVAPVGAVGTHRDVRANRRAIGVFAHRRDAEAALTELRDAGFPMSRVSLIAKHNDGDRIGGVNTGVNTGVDRNVGTGNKADEGAKAGAATGAALGGLGGLLVGLGALAIPGVGPVIAGGAAATALATAVTGGAIGAAAGGITGGLVGLGIPENRARVYSDRFNKGDYIVMVDGTESEIHQAENILRRRGIEDWAVYDATDIDRAHHHHDNHDRPVGDVRANRRAVGVFAHRRDAEAALTELRDAGFPMSRVSIIAKHKDGDRIGGVNTSVNPGVDRNVGTGNKADEGAKAGAATGAALGGLGGLLVGLGALAIPGVGPVIAGGAAATALATTVTGGAIGAAAGGITGGLVGLGIPENRARVYSDRFNRGDYLVIVDGTESEIHQAENILRRRGIEDWAVYDATDLDRVHHHHDRTVGDRTHPNYVSDVATDEPAVVIIDRRDETL
ncbi:multi-sensor signal transduction histidine kinase [Nostoc carneum NIES-2107]|nr:multi-sensor signal transduction histidine kinase [Nostoc carneum NIES-2107]